MSCAIFSSHFGSVDAGIMARSRAAIAAAPLLSTACASVDGLRMTGGMNRVERAQPRRKKRRNIPPSPLLDDASTWNIGGEMGKKWTVVLRIADRNALSIAVCASAG